MFKPIIKLPDKRLRTPCQQVTFITARTVVDDLIATLRVASGYGLAAPQIGVMVAVAIVNTKPNKDPIVLINPVIIESSPEKEIQEEGCLSIPGYWLPVERAARVTVSSISLLSGQACRFALSGLTARCAQHEIDHLNGVLITDRFKQLAEADSEAVQKQHMKRYREFEKVYR